MGFFVSSLWTWTVAFLIPAVITILVLNPRLARDGQGIATDYPDTCFYIFQMQRVAELQGRWWELGQNHPLGAPYSLGADNNPGLYEGIDLLPIAWVTGQFCEPRTNLYVIILLVLCFNAWVSSGIVFFITRSSVLSCLAGMLIGINYSTLVRMDVHLHLFKYGWVLLTLFVLGRWLDAPTKWRTSTAAIVGAISFLSSLYMGYFLGLLVVFVIAIQIIRGDLDRRHYLSMIAGGTLAGSLLVIGLIPIYLAQSRSITADVYRVRQISEIWAFASEVWQYWTPPDSSRAERSLTASLLPRDDAWGAWHYLGWTIPSVLAIAIIVHLATMKRSEISQLLPTQPYFEAERWGQRFFAFGLFMLVLSLRGGPSVFLFSLVPSFRCYGRAGALAVACFSVATPLLLPMIARSVQCVCERVASIVVVRNGWGRIGSCGQSVAMILVAGMVVSTTIVDVFATHQMARRHTKSISLPTEAEWCKWLKQQPDNVQLAAFADTPFSADYLQHSSLQQYNLHHHATLNGCNALELSADLQLLGCTLRELSPGALRFLNSLGYPYIALEKGIVERIPILTQQTWLDVVHQQNGWSIVHCNQSCKKIEPLDLDLSNHLVPTVDKVVPAKTRVTLALPIADPKVSLSGESITAQWQDSTGQRVDKSHRVLTQHLFLPGVAAWSIPTPAKVGKYQLQILRSGIAIGAAVRFDVRNLQCIDDASHPMVVFIPTKWNAKNLDIQIRNRTDRYLVTSPGVGDTRHKSQQPGLGPMNPGDWQLLIRTNDAQPYHEQRVSIPDIEANGSISIALNKDLCPNWMDRRELQVIAIAEGIPIQYQVHDHDFIAIEYQ